MHHQVAVAAISTHVVEGCVCSAPEPSPESLQQGGLYVCVGGLDILMFDKTSTDL